MVYITTFLCISLYLAVLFLTRTGLPGPHAFLGLPQGIDLGGLVSYKFVFCLGFY